MTPLFIRLTAVAAALALAAPLALAQTPAPPVAPAPVAAPAAAPAPAPPPAAQAAPGVERGKLAWYGRKFAGRKTASGEIYNPEAMTMAHRSLPFGTKVKVTNLANKKSVTLRVNDRGPKQADRIGDVSLAAARKLGMVRSGVIDAEIEVVGAPPARKPR